MSQATTYIQWCYNTEDSAVMSQVEASDAMTSVSSHVITVCCDVTFKKKKSYDVLENNV